MDVQLYVYDLSNGLARNISAALLGTYIDMIYHTGVVFQGVEYTYDGGIKALDPGGSHLGKPLKVEELGKSELPLEVVLEYMESLKEIYTQDAYNLWSHNCNNFSNDLATFMLGKGIPEYITNLPHTFLNSPMGRALVPEINKMVERRNQKNGGLLGLDKSNNVPGTPHEIASSVRNVTTVIELDKSLVEAQNSSAIIFFASASCSPCRMLYPLYDELAQETAYKTILIKVDISRSFSVGTKYNIRSTPTFVSFLHGVEQERWSGADQAKLRGNAEMLAQIAHPQHPHASLALPALHSSNTTSVLYSKIPPLGKLKAKMGSSAEDGSVLGVMKFVAARADNGAAEATLPDLNSFSRFLRTASSKLPPEIMFTIVDLLRIALVDCRFSGYFAEENEHKTISPLISYVNELKDCPYSLRLVALQMCCNLFSSPLYPPHILSCPSLSTPIMQLITTSLLDDKHHNVRVAAASLSFNLATANNKTRTIEYRESLSDGDQIELAACLLEAIGAEEESPEALKGFFLAFGYLIYRLPDNGELVDLLKSMDAQGTVLSKQKLFPNEKLVQDIGEVLLKST
ncbi:PPPDE putative peptidase domain-containing protein [Amylocarpus encephaloides]|uniref:PPPDE putative peptidase domain-containing protein n=1 Tax=Amylocarpus encephaloides TaxID=45428 RepID=A0A9P7YLP0_9HELO|nr:PPPDE putative peptidase domain-containing protein [Amylocarpus encephaloides]